MVKRLRTGETLMPLEEVVELLRYAGARKDEEHEARQGTRVSPGESARCSHSLQKAWKRRRSPPVCTSARRRSATTWRVFSSSSVCTPLQAVIFAGRHGLVEIGRNDG